MHLHKPQVILNRAKDLVFHQYELSITVNEDSALLLHERVSTQDEIGIVKLRCNEWTGSDLKACHDRPWRNITLKFF